MTIMNRQKLITTLAASLALALLLAACGGGDAAAGEPVNASGFIEADEVNIVAETSGRVWQVMVEEGAAVEEGDLLIQLDDTLVQTQYAQAQAALKAIQAAYDEAVGHARPEELAKARANVQAAQAELDGAKQAAEQARELVENPQEIQARLAATNAQAQAAKHDVEVAEAQLDEATFWRDAAPKGFDPDENNIQLLTWGVEAAQANLDAAKARYNGLQWQAGILYEMTQEPLPLIAQSHQVDASVQLAEANLQVAQAELDLLENGLTDTELALWDGQLRQAKAQVTLVEAQLDQLTLVAPFDGVVTSLPAQPGETVLPNVPLMTVANLNTLTLVIYVPETQITQLRVGEPVEIRVDSQPGKVYEGEISNIASEAEFTPRNIQTEEERVNLVFAVEITIPNPDGELRPGMPADARIEP